MEWTIESRTQFEQKLPQITATFAVQVCHVEHEGSAQVELLHSHLFQLLGSDKL
jgi:hypothetical protein